MDGAIKIADEFASAMQQLSAEAQKTSAEPGLESGADIRQQLEQIIGEFHSLAGRIQGLETNVAHQFKKLDGQIEAIRSAEGMNQRLFDSLHEELIKYRDNFLHESLQKPFIRDLLVLFDDLSSLAEQMKSASKAESRRSAIAIWRDNLENSIHALIEVLHRLEVTEIESREKVDRAVHKVVSFEPADVAEEDGQIVMRLKRGFFWRGKVLRPEEVIVKRFR